MSRARRLVPAAAGVLLLLATLDAQVPRALRLEDIYHPQQRLDFTGAVETPRQWLGPRTYLRQLRAGRGVTWQRVDAVSGDATALFETERLQAALAALPGVTSEEASSLSRSSDLVLDPFATGCLVTVSDDLYYYAFADSVLTRLTMAEGEEEEPSFSPDGRLVAFVRGNNLHVVSIETPREIALTTDGGPKLLNGKLDWLYQEEIYGRGQFRGYWWSPDSSRIAFLQLDEEGVPEYPIVDELPYRPTLEVTPYPKAGDPNPTVRLGLAAVGGSVSWVDLAGYAQDEPLVVSVSWTPDAQHVVYQVQDREQTWLALNLADVDTGETRRLLRETSPAWVNVNGNPTWLPDGSFLWLSERTGFKHLYRYPAGASEATPLTSGRWAIDTFYGADAERGWAYFSSRQRNPVGADIYRVRLGGTAPEPLSQGGGTHRASFSTDFSLYVDVWSTAATPPQSRLHRSDGSEIRVVSATAPAALGQFRLSAPEFVRVEARDGVPLNAMLIKPPDFDASRRYPVYQFTYAGPGAAEAIDRWDGTQYLFHQLLAQQGILVWVLDNRSAGPAAEAQWPVHGRLGEHELRDLEDGVAWLRQQTFVDPARIVLSGWSYGGFMAVYALTHSTSWSAGIAGAPVTDWRDYDTIYTERLMRLPRNNPEGYRQTAPRFAASQLHGRLLLVHGTMDDNVHMQNSTQFAYELQRAGKSFEMMVYPRSRHGIGDPQLNWHLRSLMLDFILRAVSPDADGPATERG